jgi:hypothetical protein
LPASRFLFFICLFLLGPNLASAQKDILDLENWNPGYLVTNEEDTLYGPIIINYQNDLVQINEENTVKTFGANQIQMVYIRENNSENERYIYSFQFHPYSDFKPFKLFEMLFSGKSLCLLAREMLVTETIPVYDNFTYRTYYSTRTRLSADYFLMFPEKKVRAFSGSKKELLNLLADKKEEMKKFISGQKLQVTQKEDLVRIVTEYNKIKQQK